MRAVGLPGRLGDCLPKGNSDIFVTPNPNFGGSLSLNPWCIASLMGTSYNMAFNL